MTGDVLDGLALNGRQRLGIAHLKAHRRISNPEYQKLTAAIPRTATRDLKDLKEKGILVQVGLRGPGVHYVLAKRGDTMGTKRTRAKR